jgi:hypothetical protein
MSNALNKIRAFFSGFLGFLGISFFGILIYNEIQNWLGLLIAAGFVILGFFLGRFVYITSVRRGFLSLSTAINASPDLDNIDPSGDSDTRKLSPQEYVDSFSKSDQKFKGGSLKIWGDFRSRSLEEHHLISNLSYLDSEAIQIDFHSGNKLTIWEPDVVFEASRFMKILSASRVRWEWNDSKKDRRFYYDYRVEGRDIKTSTDFDWKSYDIDTLLGEPAIVMIN